MPKQDQRSELVGKLSHLCSHHSIMYPPHVSEYIRESNTEVLSLLKKSKIKPADCTESVLRAAHEKHNTDWREGIRKHNQEHPGTPMVLVGDPEFDPGLRKIASNEPYPDKAIPAQKVPENSADAGWMPDEKALEGIVKPDKEMKKALEHIKPGEPCSVHIQGELKVGQKLNQIKTKIIVNPPAPPKKQGFKGKTLLGYPALAIIRWVADLHRGKRKPEKMDKDEIKKGLKKAKKLMAHFGIKLTDQTVECQYRSGRLKTTHYGPLPVLSKEVKETLKEILDEF